VANLPYSVASPILVELAQTAGCPRRLVATLQLEVARRIVATASDDDYGVLSLLLQLRYEPLGHFKIPADCFSLCRTSIPRASSWSGANSRCFRRAASRVCAGGETWVFPAAQDDVETLETGLAR